MGQSWQFRYDINTLDLSAEEQSSTENKLQQDETFTAWNSIQHLLMIDTIKDRSGFWVGFLWPILVVLTSEHKREVFTWESNSKLGGAEKQVSWKALCFPGQGILLLLGRVPCQTSRLLQERDKCT